MTNPTTPFSWQMPTSTDLVTDLPADFETFGQAVATSMADLLGGTSGQILAKASNTDMDFTWVTNDVGDITAVTAGTGITGGGTSGAVTVSFDQENFGGGQFAAAKNKIINSNFANWQRGTTLTYTSSGLNYLADRFFSWTIGTCNVTVSQQTFTPGTAPVAGYEGQYFMRNAVTSLSGQSIQAVGQRIEDVRTLAGQTATFSFWAKADSNRTYTTRFIQNFGSGGSSEVSISGGSHSVTTSWQRFSVTVSIASVSGKTIGTSSYLQPLLDGPTNTANTLDTWGWQLEAGSFATPFQTATGTIQGELAACQRYLPAITGQAGEFATGFAYSTTKALFPIVFKVQPRVPPTGITVNNAADFTMRNATATLLTGTALTFSTGTLMGSTVELTVASGMVAGDGTNLFKNNDGTILFTGCEL